MGYVSIINFTLITCFSVPLASLGAKYAHKIPQKKLKIIFSILVLYMGLKMLGIFSQVIKVRNDRKVGENFDEKMAGDIFDKLKNAEGKIKPKRKGRFDNITNLMQEAKSLEKENKCDEAIKIL